MRLRASISLCALFAAPTALAGAPDPTPDARCSVRDCVTDAVARAPEVRMQEAATDAALAQKAQARGNYGPRLMVGGGVQVWDSALEVKLANIPGLPADLTTFTARDQVTWSFNVTLAQPLAGLWSIFVANDLAALGIDVARIEREAAERSVALATTEAWLGARLAANLVTIGEASLAARESDRARAGALVKGGVLVEADLARADLGVTQARLAVSQAMRRLTLARARLSQLVGRPVAPEDGAMADPSRPLAVSSLEAAQETALRDRLEVAVLRARIAQAAAAVDLARSKLAPEVNLVAQAQFANGSQFQSDSAAFVGLTLDWTVWSWGSTAYGIDEAAANLTKAKLGEEALADGVELEVEAAWVDYQTALEQAALAAEAEKVAMVSYELTQQRLAGKAATTFDVVRAESEVTEARQNVEMARASALLARAKLARAMGGTAETIAGEVMP